MDVEAEGTVKDFIKDFIENTVKKNDKGIIITYNTYINRKRCSVRFRVFILVIQYIKL